MLAETLNVYLPGLACPLCSSVYYENVPTGSHWAKKMRDVWSRPEPNPQPEAELPQPSPIQTSLPSTCRSVGRE